MDGNGRWARARGLPRLSGHRAGTEALKRTIEACIELQVPAHEVRGLMYLLEEVIHRQLGELDDAGVQLRHIGWLDQLPRHVGQSIEAAVKRTKANDRLVLNVAFNYGSRAEIVRAVRAIVRDGVPPDQVDEDRFASYLETADCPDPDLIIRTSGEMRLSNFLLWQAAYSEIYCTDTLWPDFGRDELAKALDAYAGRQRRYGLLADDEEEDEQTPLRARGPAS
jgi:undecaprenyl diphosphate synthase